jgi:small subunit ribosomal protein S17
MAQKSEKTGVVISNKMQKSIVVAVEWQVRHGLYSRPSGGRRVHGPRREGRSQDRDTVTIVETRPMSRRKRWALKGIVRQAVQV